MKWHTEVTVKRTCCEKRHSPVADGEAVEDGPVWRIGNVTRRKRDSVGQAEEIEHLRLEL